VTEPQTAIERQVQQLQAEKAALQRGLETTAANLQWQQQRCTELAGAIEELTRRNIITVGMMETILKGVLHTLQIGSAVEISAEVIRRAARHKLVRENIDGGGVRICLVV
jgi:hypothetical protein